jgi:hypothetical protein
LKLLEFLRRPAVRVPLVLAAVVACALWASQSCRGQMRTLSLAKRRHQSFMVLLAAAAREGRPPAASLGELVWPPEAGGRSRLVEVFLRDFADRPEFAESSPPGTARSDRLGEVQVWRESGERRHEQEILWSGYMFSMYPRTGGGPEGQAAGKGGGDLVIFSWPLKAGRAQLTLAWLSTDPGRIYYTSAPRYAGPGRGPTPADLGEAPFEGEVSLFTEEDAPATLREFVSRTEESGGRLWAVEPLQPQIHTD